MWSVKIRKTQVTGFGSISTLANNSVLASSCQVSLATSQISDTMLSMSLEIANNPIQTTETALKKASHAPESFPYRLLTRATHTLWSVSVPTMRQAGSLVFGMGQPHFRPQAKIEKNLFNESIHHWLGTSHGTKACSACSHCKDFKKQKTVPLLQKSV